MLTKEEVIEKFGKHDGHDESRWKSAIQMAGEIDRHVNICFERLRKLEDDGHIALEISDQPPMEDIKNGNVFLDKEKNCLCYMYEGEMKQYPTLEEYKKMMSLLDSHTKPNWVQSLAHTVWSKFKSEWSRGDYKDKAITMESCYLMGFQNGWDAKEEEVHKGVFGER